MKYLDNTVTEKECLVCGHKGKFLYAKIKDYNHRSLSGDSLETLICPKCGYIKVDLEGVR